MKWRTRTTAETSGSTGTALASDVFTLSGMANSGTTGEGETDPYALQLTYSGSALSSITGGSGGPVLDYLNTGSNKYANAVIGDDASGTSVYSDVLSSWSSFASAHSISDANIGAYLGSWGVDTTDGEVWAVVDHNSTFAVGVSVPEPFGAVMMVSSLGLLLRRRRGERGSEGD